VLLLEMLASRDGAGAKRRTQSALARVMSTYTMDATLARYEVLYESACGAERECVSR
jgi:hypothetical protein